MNISTTQQVSVDKTTIINSINDSTMKPIKIFSDSIEELALQQFHAAMKQPYAVQGALMPDAHAGYAMPIGGVISTDDVIVPAWIGFDIGCGMCAVKTTFNANKIRANAKRIYDQIYRDIPVGFAHNKRAANFTPTQNPTPATNKILDAGGRNQIGSLGSGNHFIEIGVDETDTVWIITHSGSRNVGHKIATHYMKLASGDGKAREGHFGLNVNSSEGKAYIQDLAFGLEFALTNRLEIVSRVGKAIQQHAPGKIDLASLINRNHNHAGKKGSVWIHRKGATHAEAGMMGVIPGNMRDGSFIVKGKGNPESLFSSSHGAGRVMGRKEAKSTLNLGEFIQTVKEQGIQARLEKETLDEAPNAYKNIFEVMAMQADLVEVTHHVKPIINIKG